MTEISEDCVANQNSWVKQLISIVIRKIRFFSFRAKLQKTSLFPEPLGIGEERVRV